MSKKSIFSWLAMLTILAVGTKNFEPGLPVDGPLYAAIARTMVRTGDWINLSAPVPEFKQFFEHPHLGFWTLATVYKFLPFADWSGRIPGHLFYFCFLALLFFWIRRNCAQRPAIYAVLLLVAWPRFSNFFSAIYLDPGALVFGSLAVFLLDLCLTSERWRLAAFGAGSFVALTFLQKGLTVLGFGPALLVALVPCLRAGKWKIPAFAALGALLPIAGYVALLARFQDYPYLVNYFQRQVSHRFANEASAGGLLGHEFWSTLTHDTYFLLPLVILALGLDWRKSRLAQLKYPLALFAGFVLLYAPNNRAGWQYQILLLPWIAWMLAWLFAQIPYRKDDASWISATRFIAIVLVLLVQYLPMKTHGNGPRPENAAIDRLVASQHPETWSIDTANFEKTFVSEAAFAWYSDVRFDTYLNDQKTIAPDSKRALLFLGDTSNHELQGWCLFEKVGKSSLYSACK